MTGLLHMCVVSPRHMSQTKPNILSNVRILRADDHDPGLPTHRGQVAYIEQDCLAKY